ncbi:hypothetical protein CRUP_012007, partial [Coryphaenoides rupestris]
MSAAALRMIRCRQLSTTGSGARRVLPWKHIKKIAKVTSAVVLGGCVFVTYELLALDKALTIDTQAVQQEKYQSFIYLKTNHSNDRENFAKELTQKTRKELHKVARRFMEISSRILLGPLD